MAIVVSLSVSPASAQLDPLLFIKNVPARVIVVLDNSFRMLEDGDENYYDPMTYNTGDDGNIANAFSSGPTGLTYRRIYEDVEFTAVQDATQKYTADSFTAVMDVNSAYADFWAPTRLEIAKAGIARAVGDNIGSRYHWGLVTLRQNNPAWRVLGDCDKPVALSDHQGLRDSNPCDVAGNGNFGIYAPIIGGPNYAQGASGVRVAAAANAGQTIVDLVQRPIQDPLGIIPAGIGGAGFDDRPLTHALDDARVEIVAAMANDSAASVVCRNTVVVLVTGGDDDGDANYTASHNPGATAATFLAVSGGGVTRRVPIFVVAIDPPAADEVELQTIASSSGGAYFSVSDAAGVARVINLAVESGFARDTDFDAGTPSEFIPVSPIVGTVNLKNASDSTGGALPLTDIQSAGVDIPQRANMLLTAGFALNTQTGIGFEGRLRAFRTFRPEADASRPSGFKFVADGTPLWPDVDGRPETAGRARLPLSVNDRNIFTVIPGSGLVAFTSANAATLAPHMGGADAATVIDFVRSLPLGAIIGSTPAIMDPPSLDPPPDEDYGRTGTAGTFAGDHEDRRSIIWVGANDGMLHGFDARTGFEVWAVIPYNLLPKLQTLLDGQSVDRFDYFVDSSPKLAEVKVNGVWRTQLIIGQGWGGTFYQAFDVTEAGMGGGAPDSDNVAGVISSFADPNRVPFDWSFPRYSEFDTDVAATIAVADGTPGDEVRFFGDLKLTASPAEKSVGFTWSDPAVGPLNLDRSVNAIIVGSGYFPAVEDQLPGRGVGSARAGRSLYLIDVATGTLLGGAASCGGSGSVGCVDVGDGVADGRKNALQADAAATGASTSASFVSKAYLGDVDGRYWRFDFTETGTISFTQMIDTGQPIYSSSALLFVGTSDQHMFMSTGSDLLPPTTPGGTGTFRLFGLRDEFPAAGAVTVFTRNLATVSSGASDASLATGERPTAFPSVAGDIVFYTTVVSDASAPCADVSSNLYALTFLGGAAYDTDNSGSVTANENPIVATVAGRATAPFIADQHIFFGTSGAGGVSVEIFGDPEDFNNGVGQVGVRLLSWRELR